MNLETAPGWVALPRPGRGTPSPSAPHYVPQLILPRGPRAAAAAALYAYHPCTQKGRLAWEAARRLAGLGGFHLVPRRGAPPPVVTERLAPYLPSRTTIAVAESDHPGRFVALIVGERGKCHGVAKIATESTGQAALGNEARALGSLAKLLPPPLSAPRLLARDTGLLLLEPVRWVPRRSPGLLSDELARALGAFFRADGADGQMGPTHGDFAPWNLLKTERGWVLVDWEEARDRDRPFFDLFHYLFMAHQNLAAFSRQDFLDGLERKGPVGRAITAYAEGADLRDVDLRELLIFYLRSSGERLDLASPDGRSDYRARQRLLELLEA
jgi:Phosphotransferase enzyme family